MVSRTSRKKSKGKDRKAKKAESRKGKRVINGWHGLQEKRNMSGQPLHVTMGA